MDTTSITLLQRLRQPSAQEAWSRFVDLYTPLLYNWACRLGLQQTDAADLVQDVLALLVQKLPDFQYNRDKSFRAWLRTVLLNKGREQLRRRMPLPLTAAENLEESGVDVAAAFEEAEYRRYLVRRALQLMETDFEPKTWKACWQVVIGEKPPAVVAQELGMTVGAVRVAKSRVLFRLRQELNGLLD